MMRHFFLQIVNIIVVDIIYCRGPKLFIEVANFVIIIIAGNDYNLQCIPLFSNLKSNATLSKNVTINVHCPIIQYLPYSAFIF